MKHALIRISSEATHAVPSSTATVAGYRLTVDRGSFVVFESDAIRDIWIPATYESFTQSYRYPFKGNVDGIEVTSSNKYLKVDGNILYNKDMTTVMMAPAALTDTLYLKESVTALKDNAFACTQLSKVVLHDGITNIGACCFYGADFLSTLVVPRSVKSLGEFFLSGANVKDVFILTDDFYWSRIPNHAFSSEHPLDSLPAETVIYTVNGSLSKIKECWVGRVEEIFDLGDDNIFISEIDTAISSYSFRVVQPYNYKVEVSEENPEINLSVENDYYVFSGYKPGATGKIHFSYTDDKGKQHDILHSFKLRPLQSDETAVTASATPHLSTCTFTVVSEVKPSPQEIGVYFNDTYYPADSEGEVVISGLKPETEYTFQPYAEIDGARHVYSEQSFTTGNPLEGVTVQTLAVLPKVVIFKVNAPNDLAEYEDIRISGDKYLGDLADSTGLVMCDGLEIGKTYSFTLVCEVGGEIYSLDGFRSATIPTFKEMFSVYMTESTQTTMSFKVTTSIKYPLDSYGLTYKIVDTSSSVTTESVGENNIVLLDYCKPNTSYYIKPFFRVNNEIYYDTDYWEDRTYFTKSTNARADLYATSVLGMHFKGTYAEGNAGIKYAKVEIDGTTYKLDPKESIFNLDLPLPDYDPANRTHKAVFYISNTYDYSAWWGDQWDWVDKAEVELTMPLLEWTDGEAVPVSATTARLLYNTNLPDGVETAGIEWRRVGAPDIIASTSVACPVVNGRLVGLLKNLKDNVYYKFRPYYTATSGTKYYGEWVGIFTGDAAVTFEPEVMTFAGVTGDNTVTLKGYSLEGSEPIIKQGFEYRPASAMFTAMATEEPSWTSVTAKGIMMSAELDDLMPSTEYIYRAFVTTASGTYYGEEQRFVSPIQMAGIDDIIADDADIAMVLRENPVSGEAHVSIAGNGDEAMCSLYTMQGVMISSQSIVADGQYHAIDVNSCPGGMYLLYVAYGGERQCFKLIVK